MKSLVNRNLLPCRFGENEKQLEAESQKRYNDFLDNLKIKYCYSFPHKNILKFCQNQKHWASGGKEDDFVDDCICDHARAFYSEEFQQRFLIYQPYGRQVKAESVFARECAKRNLDCMVSKELSWHMPGSTCLYIVGTKEFIEYAKEKLL